MDRSAFWNLVEQARSSAGEDDESFVDDIRSRLQGLSADGILGFERSFNQLHAASYGWNLWGAAYLMNGGCSDDGFEYFRAWLIAQGRSVFEAAMRDPETLVSIESPEGELEEFMYVAGQVYEEKTGEPMPSSIFEEVARPELGEGWDFDDPDQMKQRYPKLFARYGG